MTNYPTLPFLGLHKLPLEQRPAGELVRHNLGLLLRHVLAFERTLQLYDFCMLSVSQLEQKRNELRPPEDLPLLSLISDKEGQLMDWRQIAGRDGALTIYHYSMSAAGVRKALSLCPGLQAQINHDTLRKAIKGFAAAFPGNLYIRHAVAHAAETARTPDDVSEHGIVGAFRSPSFDLTLAEPAIICGVIDGRRYSEGWKGQIFEYELSQASVDKLVATTQAIYAAFREPSL
jgi:hypothetical protein